MKTFLKTVPWGKKKKKNQTVPWVRGPEIQQQPP